MPERTTYLLAAPYSDAAILKVSDQATRLMDSSLSMSERQLLYAQMFRNLPEPEQPLSLYAVSLYASFKIASDGKVLSETALAENLVQSLAVSESPKTEGFISITRPFADGVSESPQADGLAGDRLRIFDEIEEEVAAGQADRLTGDRLRILNLYEIAAIGAQAETYVKGLCVLFADQVMMTPFEEAIFVGLLTGGVSGLGAVDSFENLSDLSTFQSP